MCMRNPQLQKAGQGDKVSEQWRLNHSIEIHYKGRELSEDTANPIRRVVSLRLHRTSPRRTDD